MHNVKATDVSLTVHNDTCTTHVASTSDHADVPSVKLDKIGNLVLLEVEAHSVIGSDKRVGIPDGASIVSNNVWDTPRTNSHTLHFEKLIVRLLWGDTVNGKATLDIIQQTEVLARLFDRYDVCASVITPVPSAKYNITCLGNQ